MKLKFRIGGIVSVAALALTACAGGVGSAEGGAVEGEGVEFGASKEEYIEALVDMEPVELTYQASASASSPNSDREREFVERVEEWSDGKITMDMQFGQPIVGYGEIASGASDGRIDIGLEVPAYSPSDYPALSELVRLQTIAASGSHVAEMINIGANLEVVWNTPEVLEQYEEKDVQVLMPAEYEFPHYLMCTDENATVDTLEGAVISADSPSDIAIVESIGATPTSLPYVEVYEGLQRGVVDCSMMGAKAALSSGLNEVAPHIVAPIEGAWGRNATAVVAGGKWNDLPLAAQQLIFDSMVVYLNGHMNVSTNANVEAMEAFSGGYHEIDAETQENLNSGSETLRSEVAESDAVEGQQLVEDYETAVEKWTDIVAELGYEDHGQWPEFAEYVETNGAIDYQPFAERVIEEVFLPHRPGS